MIFNEAVELIKELNPSTEDKLKLYGLYKQATLGDVNTKKPVFDFVGKWNAWNERKGMSKEDAENEYINLVQDLRKNNKGYKRNEEDRNVENEMGPVFSSIKIQDQDQQLLQNLPDDYKDSNGNTLLHLAVDQNNIELVKKLVKKININAVNLNNETPLHFACICAYDELVEMLLENGADLSVLDGDGKRAFGYLDGGLREKYEKHGNLNV